MEAGFYTEHAVIVFSDAAAGREDTSGQMLQELLFCPVAAWIVQALKKLGIKHFFALCKAEEEAQVKACFTDPASVTCGNDRAALDAFLEREKPQWLLGVTKPVLITAAAAIQLRSDRPWPEENANGGIFRVAGEALKAALHNGGSLLGAMETASGVAYEKADGTLLRPVSTPWELYQAQAAGRLEVAHRHMENGVLFLDLDTVYIDPRVKIGAGTMILPGTILKGKTVIGNQCEIGPNTMISNCTVGDHTVVNASQCNDSVIGARTKVGPFAYMRPNCRIGDDVKVGDFVEVKNSILGNGTKVSHLTYVGDSDVGAHVNLGCGTVTVNYDGAVKARTVVKDGAFVGCNANLVAPVTVGEGAYVAAGSTITEDVPPGSLAIARDRQTNKPEWKRKTKK